MKKTQDWKSIMYIFLAFCIMGILYASSSMPYQDQNVQPLLARVLAGEPLRSLFEMIRFSYGGNEVSVQSSGYNGFVEFFIRKAAHFGAYFLLSLLWFLGLKNKTSSYIFAAFLAFMLAAGYASFDELRQSFNPNRTALMEDVLLDSIGAVAGIAAAWLAMAGWSVRKKKKRTLRFR